MTRRLALPVLLPGILLLARLMAEDRGIAVVPTSPDETPLVGNHWMFLIGINRYQEWPPLRGPVHDVKALKKVLVERYWYNPDHIVELFDERATKRNIRKALNDLMDGLRPEDTLMVYYAGHGQLSKNNVGYWIPHDGGMDEVDQRNWISSADLKGYMLSFKCRHVLLLADSCFSGDLLDVERGAPEEITQEFYRKAYARMSRQVLTSGALEPVPDTGIGDHSEFAFHLIRELEGNTQPYLDPLKLFANLRTGVTKTLPLMGSLRDAGHQKGGTYVFFRRPVLSTDYLTKVGDEARASEDRASTVAALQAALARYQDYLRDASPEKFPQPVEEARGARERLEHVLNGIALLRAGNYAKAGPALGLAVEKYQKASEESQARKQVLHWQMALKTLEAIEGGEMERASEMLQSAGKESRPDEPDEALRYLFRFGSVVDAWKTLDEAAKPSQLLAHLKDRPRVEELLEACRLAVQAGMDQDVPPGIQALSKKRTQALKELLSQEIPGWLEQAEKLERQGRFDAVEGSAWHYRVAAEGAGIAETAGGGGEVEATKKRALAGLTRSQESERFLSETDVNTLLPEVRKWVGREGDAAAAKYWSSLIPLFEACLKAGASLTAADSIQAWVSARDEMLKVEQEVRNSERLVRYHPELAQKAEGLRKKLEAGIQACQDLGQMSLASISDPAKLNLEVKAIFGRYPPDLSVGPAREALLKLRRRILEEGEKLEFGQATQDAFRAADVYALMPAKLSLEAAEAEDTLAQARKATERVRGALRLAHRVLESSGNEGLALLETDRPQFYPDKMPDWFGRIERNFRLHPKLIDEGTAMLKACQDRNCPDTAEKLKALREKLKCGQCHHEWARTWEDYQGMRMGRMWRDVQLAYKFNLFRKVDGAEGEYVFRSDHDDLEFAMVWVANAAPAEGPGFFMDKNEVSIGSFSKFWKEKRENQPGFLTWESQFEEIKPHLEKMEDPGLQFPDHWPVALATYKDAEDFAAWSNLKSRQSEGVASKGDRRLPSEKEWRRAAFGGPGSQEERLYPWGHEGTKSQCNVSGRTPMGEMMDPWLKLVPTVLFENDDRSAWGCLGMGGNVSEWVTWRPGGNLQVILGSNFEESLDRASSAFPRSTQPIDTRKGSTGFRCALEIPSDWDMLE
ncbi:MAG: SUMF1/EgtB/PvdO family nonheme iron enzyme [Planctomycetes bacterium]|nr:SUMF1/EgtB/PvdO family nonheme iron enzyme [Planctomycetota bacterium]